MKKLKITLYTIFITIFILSLYTMCFGAENVYKGSKSEIDAIHSSEGYVKIRYLKETTKKLKVIIEKDTGKYTYDLNNKGDYETYPLQMGNGTYKIKIFENITGNKYSIKQTTSIKVTLDNENSPFLVSNQYVKYENDSETVKKAKELTKEKKEDIDKIDVIYDYIITNIVYDTKKAESVESGYLPEVDEILKSNKGICFDYASIMAAMLRSQSIPTKLVTGYSSNLDVLHAWNEVYTEETGWIKLNEMYFDGHQWKLMDSTIASTAKQSNSPKMIEYTKKLTDSKYYTKYFEY